MPEKLIIYVDGASRGNPGPSAIGGIILDENGEELEKFSEYIGEGTNNQAEYMALIEALKRAKKYNPKVVEVRSDSELMVKQLEGQYRVKNAELANLSKEVKEIASEFKQVRFVHVPREENQVSDALCNRALDLATKKYESVKGKFNVTVHGKFDCAHKLVDYEGKCSFLHGHTYKVEVAVAGTQLKNGILIDIVVLKKILKEILDEFDHKYLNELEQFKGTSPTAENICILIAGEMAEKLPPNVYVEYIRVYESDEAAITYYPSGRR